MNIFLDTIGCRLNQSEIETYARQFRAAGHFIVPEIENADIVVINTCAVTAAAASDSRQKIRQAVHTGIEKIVVTGCWTTIDPEGVRELTGVTQVVPNAIKENLVSNLLEIDQFDLEPIAREPIPGSRMRTRAFIKAQDGCNNRCSYCITTIARGKGRSRSVHDVLSDVKAAQIGDTKEIVLTGVHLGSWGVDLNPPTRLYHLIKYLLDNTNVPRIRISSLEPWDMEDDFFNLWKDPRLCRHLHLPLQSGSAEVLRRMARKTSPEAYEILINTARAEIPGVAITTDVMTGFPGETEDEFLESLHFVEKMKFSGGHVFTYSERPGTLAANMPGYVHNATRKERSRMIRKVIKNSAVEYKTCFLDEEVLVLWESSKTNDSGAWELKGLTENYLKVRARSGKSLWNQITNTCITSLTDDGLFGTILGKSTTT
jgi:threonylcarbamoyladenosine tRNA methylthiotransferase MtaB